MNYPPIWVGGQVVGVRVPRIWEAWFMGQKPLEIAPADSVAAAVLSAKRDASNIPKGVLAKTSGVSPTRLRSILDAKRPMRRSWVCRGGW